MDPYTELAKAVAPDDKVLSLCAGVGFELHNLQTKDITAVDIAPQHVEQIVAKYPHIEGVVSDALKYLKKAKDNSFDVVSLIDGVEHMPKKTGLAVLKECKRVAKREVVVFTPKGFVKNEPHNAWGIEGADQYQVHQSGWEPEELQELGYTVTWSQGSSSQHGEPITEMMYSYKKV